MVIFGSVETGEHTVALRQSQKNWVAEREKCSDVNYILHASLEGLKRWRRAPNWKRCV
jgi:hypothetical protein